MSKITFHKTLFYFVFCILSLIDWTLYGQEFFPWPVTPFNDSHMITGVFCEYRDTGTYDHFHNGTDIPKPDGSPVYAVKDGQITSIGTVASQGSNAFVRVEDIAYVHIEPNPALSVGQSVIANQTVLGTILSGMGHVHFTDGYVGSERNSLLTTRGFTPYDDPWSPIIRSVSFYQNNTVNRFSSNEVSGVVDIIVHVEEQNGPPGSSSSVLNNGTYKIGYKILSEDGSTVVFEPPNGGVKFQFDTKPSNNYVNIVFFKPLSSTSSHVYQVTNDINKDNYWDTRFLPDSNYVVMVFTEDTRQNTDTVYVAVKVVETDITAPAQPNFKYVLETEQGIGLGWTVNDEPDLVGYRLFFSFDNNSWTVFKDETVYTPGVTDTTIVQVLNQDVYFRVTAVDNAPLPNESVVSDVYGLSNGDAFLGKVLIVDGFDRISGGWSEPFHSFGFTYGRAVITNQFSFDTVPNEAIEESMITLNDYEAVIWFLGDESTGDETFSPQEQALVRVYLENGGKLLVSGSEIARDLDQDYYGSATAADEAFLHGYLRADYSSNNPGSLIATGTTGSVFEGVSLQYGQIPYAIDSADVISPYGANTVGSFKYDESKFAAIQYEGIFGSGTIPGKILYLAFPFETIEGENIRQQVMTKVLEFFFDISLDISNSDDADPVPNGYALMQNYPNPFNPETIFEYRLPEASIVTLAIYNSLGQKVRTLVVGHQSAGSHEILWDGLNDADRKVASGIYIVRFHAQGNSSNESFQKSLKVVLAK